MAEINKDSLDDALRKKDEPKNPEMTKEMEMGFHQGSLNTLINERNELIRMAQQVERLMQAHMKRLEELGVKIKRQESQSS